MHIRSLRWITGLLVLGIAAAVWATSPAPVAEVAPLSEILLEVDAKIELLETALESPEKYDSVKDKDAWQGFGVLAVLGQAIAEHPGQSEAGFSGAALRDAALQYQQNASYSDARAALEAVQSARAGNGSGETEFAWNKLIRMHPMMEEINARNAKLLPIFRRPRGRPQEPVHATTIALLSLAMYADTHEVKNEADIPAWQAMAAEYREAMVGVAAALREKNGKSARELFDKANATCDACHEKFRDVE